MCGRKDKDKEQIDMQNYNIVIRLTGLIGAEVMEKDNESGIFIPLAPNGLKVWGRGVVYMNVFAIDTGSVNRRGYTHDIILKRSEGMGVLGYTKPVYIGNMGKLKSFTKYQKMEDEDRKVFYEDGGE